MIGQTKNRILRSLGEESRQRILDTGQRVRLEAHATLDVAGVPTSSIYFPETALISVLAGFDDGRSIEMVNIGRESCTGIARMLGQKSTLNTTTVQIDGDAIRLGARDFTTFLEELPDFGSAIRRCAHAFFNQVMISGACNGVHPARKRLARWLVTVHDTSQRTVILLTQDFIASILGVRRATVTEAASQLQERGYIRYARGRIEILDIDGLRASSCECYDLVRSTYRELLPLPSEKDDGVNTVRFRTDKSGLAL